MNQNGPSKYHANKNLGQHFLKDQSLISKICHSHNQSLSDIDFILEVGPGPGALTFELDKIGKPLYLIEKDTRFVEDYQKLNNLKKVFNEDALKLNFQDIIKGQKVWLVSNLPYNISSLLFINFSKCADIKFMTLMFQKEVGLKTFQDLKQKRGSLLTISETFWKSNILSKVPPGAFSPPPKVDSIVLTYERLNNSQVDLTLFEEYEKFLRILFSLPRKMMKQAFKGGLTQLYQHFQSQDNFDLNFFNRRAETLSIDEIYFLWQEHIKFL